MVLRCMDEMSKNTHEQEGSYAKHCSPKVSTTFPSEHHNFLLLFYSVIGRISGSLNQN